MVDRTADAEWNGGLQDGTGRIRLGSGAFEGAYSFKTRFGDEKGTNPEELIGAAHAGCFSMALAANLGRAGLKPERIHTTAKVTLEKSGTGFAITHIALETEARIPDASESVFRAQAEAAKRDCPVSRALAATNITLTARLV